MRETLRRLLPASVDSQLLLTQNNPYTRVAYFRVADSNPLHCLRTLCSCMGSLHMGSQKPSGAHACMTWVWMVEPLRTVSSFVPWAFCVALKSSLCHWARVLTALVNSGRPPWEWLFFYPIVLMLLPNLFLRLFLKNTCIKVLSQAPLSGGTQSKIETAVQKG